MIKKGDFIKILLLVLISTSLFAQCQEDLNGDGIANVVDIVSLVNFILSDGSESYNQLKIYEEGGLDKLKQYLLNSDNWLNS